MQSCTAAHFISQDSKKKGKGSGFI